jgi:hypothetical protein
MDYKDIGQFFEENFKKDDNIKPVKSGEIVNFIFTRYSYSERVKLMNFIDNFIIDELKIKESNLPWRNTINRDLDEDWTNFIVQFRMAIARILDQMATNKKGHRLN